MIFLPRTVLRGEEHAVPYYQCFPAPGLAGPSERALLAEEFTRIHVEVTGAPAAFVTVAFVDRPEGTIFTGGKPSANSIVSGFVRAGRDRETRRRLLAELSEAWHRVTGQDESSLVLGLIEVDPTSTMEAGLIMPAPGEEAAWFERHRDRLTALTAMYGC
jgi:phenylpyruvate tautomerase PptA (4-oxalocrotonate tautomerase family)